MDSLRRNILVAATPTTAVTAGPATATAIHTGTAAWIVKHLVLVLVLLLLVLLLLVVLLMLLPNERRTLIGKCPVVGIRV